MGRLCLASHIITLGADYVLFTLAGSREHAKILQHDRLEAGPCLLAEKREQDEEIEERHILLLVNLGQWANCVGYFLYGAISILSLNLRIPLSDLDCWNFDVELKQAHVGLVWDSRPS